MDVFVRVWAPNVLRLGMAISTIARWEMESRIHLTLVMCEESLTYSGWKTIPQIKLPAQSFSRNSLRTIEEMATGEIYAGADDDMLIYGPRFIERGLELMRRNPEYGCIVASPTNEPVLTMQNIPEVVESHAVGGAGLVRKGLAEGFPDISNSAYAGWLHQQMLNRGYKQGYARDLRYCHLGSRYSFASPAHCDGV